MIVMTRTAAFEYMNLDKNNKSIGSTCMASAWYDYLLEKFMTFIDKTGFSMVETDGPYPG